ncbi:MAG TPA: mercuric reductase [Polyangiaceae bacterium]|jgi:pyruvate/2-oxoglutarate dehydrogenase complex dihydrolipoamide dehydrogenase (E3) component
MPDVIIIGTGQAGVPLATRLAAAGRRVLVVERSNPGGTCVNYGCTPTKAMIASARAAHVARTAGRLGVHTGEVNVDFHAIIERKTKVVNQWREGVVKRLHGSDRIEVLTGHARFVGPHSIDVAGARHAADTIIVNVGARHAVPKIDGLDCVPWLDSHRVMELTELPRHLVVIGAGYVACEFAQMFRRFGSEVTIIGKSAHLLSREDEDISKALEDAFRSEDIRLELGKSTTAVARDGEGVRIECTDRTEVRGTHLLVATGRRPNTDDLGCEAAGIALDARGYIQVDDAYETSVQGVYAVGDATPQPQFTHTSWDDHRLLFDRLMGHKARARSERIIPYAVFTDPQVAGVGLSEKEARDRNIQYEVATMPFGRIARAIEIDETAGAMKVLFDPRTDRVLGARLVGADAGELIHIFVTLMQANASVRAIVDAEFVHPTFAEGVQSLVMKSPRYALQ